jgi:hypothetical protein
VIGVTKPLAWWTRQRAYFVAAVGGCRYSLGGTEAGGISEQHRAIASLGRAGRVTRGHGRPAVGETPDGPVDCSAPLAARMAAEAEPVR